MQAELFIREAFTSQVFSSPLVQFFLTRVGKSSCSNPLMKEAQHGDEVLKIRRSREEQ